MVRMLLQQVCLSLVLVLGSTAQSDGVCQYGDCRSSSLVAEPSSNRKAPAFEEYSPELKKRRTAKSCRKVYSSTSVAPVSVYDKSTSPIESGSISSTSTGPSTLTTSIVYVVTSSSITFSNTSTNLGTSTSSDVSDTVVTTTGESTATSTESSVVTSSTTVTSDTSITPTSNIVSTSTTSDSSSSSTSDPLTSITTTTSTNISTNDSPTSPSTTASTSTVTTTTLTTTTTTTTTAGPTTTPSPQCTDRATLRPEQQCGCSYQIRCNNGVDESPIAVFTSPDYVACMTSCDQNPSCGVSEYRNDSGEQQCFLYPGFGIDEITVGDWQVAKRIQGTCSNSQCIDHNPENDPPPPPPPATLGDCVDALPSSCADLVNYNGFNLIDPLSNCAGGLNDLTGQISDSRLNAIFDSCFAVLNQNTIGASVANCISGSLVCPVTTTTTTTSTATTTTTTTTSDVATPTTCARNLDDPNAVSDYCDVGFNYYSGLLIQPIDNDITSTEACALSCFQTNSCQSFTYYDGGGCGLFADSVPGVFGSTDNNPSQGDTDGDMYDLGCFRCATTPPPVLPTCVSTIPGRCGSLGGSNGFALIGPANGCTSDLDALRGQISHVSIDNAENCFNDLNEDSNGMQAQNCVAAAIVCTTSTTSTSTTATTAPTTTTANLPTPTTVCNTNNNPQPDSICGQMIDYDPSTAITTLQATLSKEECSEYCAQEADCASFSIEWNRCVLFNQPATDIAQNASPGSSGILYDATCFTCQPGTPPAQDTTCTPVSSDQFPQDCRALTNSDFVYNDYTTCLDVLNVGFGPVITNRVVQSCGAPFRGMKNDVGTFNCISVAVRC